MKLNDFQKECQTTAIYRDGMTSLNERLSYCVHGLTSEAGEVAGKLKKVMRDNGGYIGFEEAMALQSEVGDVLWYCAMILDELHIDLGACANGVLRKLAQRKDNGKLGGSGDDR